MKYTVIAPETEARLATVDHLEAAGGIASWAISIFDEKNVETKHLLDGSEIRISNGACEIAFEGKRFVFPVHTQSTDGSIMVATALGTLRLLTMRGASLDSAAKAGAGQKSIKSSMPGKVIKLLCKPGDTVEAGQSLLIIEAMKMENEIRSPQPGVVEEISVDVGKKVESGELLVKLGPLKS